ncbi:MFS transporter [Aeromicrobium sp. Leaf350]|uniref:MFS transporter n=1 Tax=Aeromicrobium sp. Leaf350 TaxID=2876565 RepID=UPI001E51AF60|nr:MFS transporter [Aeromicrobium sp. Leaf350]
MNHLPDQARVSSSIATERPSRNALIGIGALLVILTNAVIFVLPPLLPVIQSQYGLATVAQSTWLYTALTLGGGAGFILLPRLADLHGDRNASIAAVAVLAVGAGIPAAGDSYPTLLAGCVLMGFGCAAQLLPLGFLRRNLGESGIAVGVAVLVIATGAGIVVGMIGGGYIVENLSLRSFFMVLTVASVLTVAAAAMLIPHTPPAERNGRIGLMGTIWMLGWVAAVLLTLTQGLVWGNAALIPLVIGVVGGVLWVRAERRSSTAVFDLRLMRAPLVTAACVSIALFAAINSAFLLLLSSYAQVLPEALRPTDAYGLGLSALETGLLMLPFAATFVVGSVVVDRPVANGHGVVVFVIGALFSVAGLAWLAVAHDRPWHYLVGAAVMGLGCSIGYAAGFTMVQSAAPVEQAGMAAGAAGTFMAVGFAIGTAVISADLSASLIPVPGTGLEVATEGLYGIGYWLSAVLGVLVIVTVVVARYRAARRPVAVTS